MCCHTCDSGSGQVRHFLLFCPHISCFPAHVLNPLITLSPTRLKDLPGNFADQSEDTGKTHTHTHIEHLNKHAKCLVLLLPFFTVDQSHQSCSEVTANALYSISHNSQRVAHKCPQCSKCFIYRSQVSMSASAVILFGPTVQSGVVHLLKYCTVM